MFMYCSPTIDILILEVMNYIFVSCMGPIHNRCSINICHGLYPSEQDPDSPIASPPIGKLPQASYLYPSEGRQNENHNYRKLTKLITWITALSNSMKLWTIPWRATQDGWVMVESSDKTWSTGEGNGKPPVFLPWEPCERYEKAKKIWHWKMKSPGW